MYCYRNVLWYRNSSGAHDNAQEHDSRSVYTIRGHKDRAWIRGLEFAYATVFTMNVKTANEGNCLAVNKVRNQSLLTGIEVQRSVAWRYVPVYECISEIVR